MCFFSNLVNHLTVGLKTTTCKVVMGVNDIFEAGAKIVMH